MSILQGSTTISWAGDPSVFVPLQPDELEKLNSAVQEAVKKSPVRIKAVTGIHHVNIEEKIITALAPGSIKTGVSFQLSKEGPPITIDTDRLEQSSTGTLRWDAHVRGDPNSSVHFIVDRKAKSLFGDIRVRGLLFEIRPIGNGKHTIYTLALKKLPPDHEPRKHKPPIGDVEHDLKTPHLLLPPASYDVRPITDEGVITPVELVLRPYAAEEVHTEQMDAILVAPPKIDVMVLYTTKAAQMAEQIGTQICSAIDQVRSSFVNSGVLATIRLVHSGELNYDESAYTDPEKSGNLNLILSEIKGLDTVKKLRDKHGADVVSVWVSDVIGGGTACGMSSEIVFPPTKRMASSAYSVVLRSCATAQLSFGHELGHLFGANHDRFEGLAGLAENPNTYNWGYVKADKGWRTIMAYNRKDCTPSPVSDGEPDCDRLNNWSNPTVPHEGDATGRPTTIPFKGCTSKDGEPSDCDGPAFDALALNDAAKTVAHFRNPKSGELCAP